MASRSNITAARIDYCLFKEDNRWGQETRKLTGDITITNKDQPLLVLDPNTSDRNVTLPAVEKGLSFRIVNNGTANVLTVKDAIGPNTIAVVSNNELVTFMSDGVAWYSDATRGSSTFADAANLAFGTTTGTKIGTSATQKIGFWNATPIVQPSGAAQAAVTDGSGGTANAATGVQPVTGTLNSTILNNSIATILALQNAMRTAMVNAGLMKGSA